jgi:hypothetical protein
MINERMMELINEVSKGNKRAFSKLVGVTPTVIENIVGTRKGKPGYELLEKIAFAIENINLDWLLTGRGTMLLNQSPIISAEIPNDTPFVSRLFDTIEKKDLKIEELLKENARLEERLRLIETERSDFGQNAGGVSSESTLLRTSQGATSAGAHLKE